MPIQVESCSDVTSELRYFRISAYATQKAIYINIYYNSCATVHNPSQFLHNQNNAKGDAGNLILPDYTILLPIPILEKRQDRNFTLQQD